VFVCRCDERQRRDNGLLGSLLLLGGRGWHEFRCPLSRDLH
jgi:hypothetical protein